MQFKDIPGQADIKQRLIRSVANDRISHAQLFIGKEGTGTLPMAIAYSQYISCSAKLSDDSCGTCPSCVKFSKLVHPDLHFSYPVVTGKSGGKPKSTDFVTEWREAIATNPFMNIQEWLQFIEAENKQGNITVEECHDIIKRLSFKSYESSYKTLILWMPEYLGNAGNTLLKLIEEPPEKTLIILVAENEGQIISTITSRTQAIRFQQIDDNNIQEYLKNKGLDDAQASVIARLSDGNVNEAIRLSNSELTMEFTFAEMFIQWMRNCFNVQKSIGKLVDWADEVSKIGRERQKAFLSYGMYVTRECLIKNHGALNLIKMHKQEEEMFQKFFPFIHGNNGQEIFEELNKAYYHVERNANPKILFLDLSIRMNSFLRIPAPEPTLS